MNWKDYIKDGEQLNEEPLSDLSTLILILSGIANTFTILMAMDSPSAGGSGSHTTLKQKWQKIKSAPKKFLVAKKVAKWTKDIPEFKEVKKNLETIKKSDDYKASGKLKKVTLELKRKIKAKAKKELSADEVIELGEMIPGFKGIKVDGKF